MAQKSSTFIQETRNQETWLTGSRETDGEPTADQLLAVASLARGAISSIPVSEEDEEKSRARAVACLQEMSLNRSAQRQIQAPWYLRLGRMLRFVFTFGRRR